jgi:hypothetical protein
MRMLEWIVVVVAVSLAVLYLCIRAARWLRARRPGNRPAHPSRPQRLTIGGKRLG